MIVRGEPVLPFSPQAEWRLTALARELMADFPELRRISWRVEREDGDCTDYEHGRELPPIVARNPHGKPMSAEDPA